jgi:hypothetical protein
MIDRFLAIRAECEQQITTALRERKAEWADAQRRRLRKIDNIIERHSRPRLEPERTWTRGNLRGSMNNGD